MSSAEAPYLPRNVKLCVYARTGTLLSSVLPQLQ